VSDTFAEWHYCYCLYAMGGGLFAFMVAAWKMSSPRGADLLIVCGLFSFFGFAMARTCIGAHVGLESLRSLTQIQEHIRNRIEFNVEFVGSVLSSLSAVLGGEALHEFIRAERMYSARTRQGIRGCSGRKCP
jgi:hypothetical protein